jgi:hypothetical protein
VSRFQSLCSLFFALYTLPASAIVDANNNGMSDLWEQQFNTGELFAESFAAQDDADSDGWTNEQEATAGTDPLDAKPPVGILCPELTYSNDVWLDLNGDGANEFYPAVATIKWPVTPGKLYTLLFSPDLTQESWLTVDRASSEIDAERTCYVPLTQPEGGIPDKCFWRIRVEDADTDGDGLTDAEELQIGSSRFLADTDGDGMNDAVAFAAGKNPAGDGTDADGDGVPDNELFSVVFEIQGETHSMPLGIGFDPFGGTGNLHRYLTYKDTEKYNITDSAQYPDIADGEHVTTATHLVGGAITENGQPVTVVQGTTFDDWKSAHELTLGEGESLDPDDTVTTGVGPTFSATEIKTITTSTTVWRVKKNGSVIRSGTETIVVTEQFNLCDVVTYQDLWNDHVKARPWHESPPSKYGPTNLVDYNRSSFGDAKAAEAVRDYFIKGDFDVFGVIGSPGPSTIDYGGDEKLKYARWGWVKFNPLSPFGYEYAAPPASYRKNFHLLVKQNDYLDYRAWTGNAPLTDETNAKGIIGIECAGTEGIADWQVIPLTKFNTHTIEDPVNLAEMDFSKWGGSRVWFGNLPVKIVPDSNMVGIIGDVIKSTITNSDKSHFVTPKQSAELNQPYVELVAHGLTPEQFGQYFEWEGGEPGSAANKRKVKRDTHGMADVSIKSRTSGASISKMRVWVVWCDITPTRGTVDFLQYPYNAGVKYETKPDPENWKFVFKVQPANICGLENPERPNLSGENKKNPPGFGKAHTIDPMNGYGDSALYKWDVSRQYKITIRNPGSIVYPSDKPVAWYVNQPKAIDVPVDFPAFDVEGNDDPQLINGDEDADPYLARSGSGLDHVVGELSSVDAPTLSLKTFLNAGGKNYAKELNFREFTRLELWDGKRESGQFWYRISDFQSWHHYLNATFDGATLKWIDTASSSDVGHPKP